jgi:dihydrofolate reductase
MRRVVVWNLMSLDGRFEGERPWDLGFHEGVWGPELEAFSLEQGKEVGTLLFGRATFDGMAEYWRGETGPVADFMNSVENVVVSHSPARPAWTNSRVLSGDLLAEVQTLRAQAGKDIFVFGSADVVGQLLRAGLVDELRIGLAPVVLGRGKPLFEAGLPTSWFDLVETRPLKTGAVLLFFRPKAQP